MIIINNNNNYNYNYNYNYNNNNNNNNYYYYHHHHHHHHHQNHNNNNNNNNNNNAGIKRPKPLTFWHPQHPPIPAARQPVGVGHPSKGRGGPASATSYSGTMTMETSMTLDVNLPKYPKYTVDGRNPAPPGRWLPL